MRSGSFLGIVLSMTVMAGLSHAQSHEALAPSDAPVASKPLLLEKNEGELRTRRPRPKPVPSSQFLLKVDPKNNGSRHLVVGTEDIAPGAFIPTHKHPGEDEVLLIHSGTARVSLGDQQRDLHAGGLVFIPANTWIGLKNISAEPVSVTFIFSDPGFEEFQRCISVSSTNTPTPMSEEELKQCEAPGHMIYK
jgi:quercetin dioxygenase-like cupin family protein